MPSVIKPSVIVSSVIIPSVVVPSVEALSNPPPEPPCDVEKKEQPPSGVSQD